VNSNDTATRSAVWSYAFLMALACLLAAGSIALAFASA
jgi:hypothetical protein